MPSDAIAALAGQVLVSGFPGERPPGILLIAATRGRLAGFILFKRNLGSPAEVAALNRELARTAPAESPLLLTLDQEGGRVARLGPPVVTLPPMRTLGRIDRPSLTRDAAHLLGRQLRALGFNADLAPVLDVDTNPANPVIGDRSFGGTPELVIRHGLAFIDGLQQAGVAACAKHFPGHGDTALDSHLALPCLEHGRERLDRIEIAPFRAAAPHAAAVMTAHLVVRFLDSGLPATLSRAVVTGLLREQLGFRGAVVSDDLEMKAIADRYAIEDAAQAAIEAGCDILLVCSGTDLVLRAHEALVRCAEKDAGFARKLRLAAERSLALRRRFPPAPEPAGADLESILLSFDPGLVERRIAAGDAERS